MCRYRYYFFGGCQHHELQLFGFCDNATPLPYTASTEFPETGKRAALPSQCQRATRLATGEGCIKQEPPDPSATLRRGRAPRVSNEYDLSAPLEPFPKDSTLRGRTLDSTSLSISRSASDLESQPRAYSLPRYHSGDSSSSHPDSAMASLAPFSSDTFRRWMTKHSVQQSEQDASVTLAEDDDVPSCRVSNMFAYR